MTHIRGNPTRGRVNLPYRDSRVASNRRGFRAAKCKLCLKRAKNVLKEAETWDSPSCLISQCDMIILSTIHTNGWSSGTGCATMFDAFLGGELKSLDISVVLDNDQSSSAVDALLTYHDLGRWPEEPALIDGAHVLEDQLIFIDFAMSSVDLDDEEDFCVIDIGWRTTSRQGRELTNEERHKVTKLEAVSDVLRTLRTNEALVPLQLNCTSFYRLSLERWAPFIALPLLQTEIPGTMLNRVSGVRMTSDASSVGSNYAILDLLSEATMGVSLGFVFEHALSDEIFEAVSAESDRIRRRLVRSQDD